MIRYQITPGLGRVDYKADPKPQKTAKASPPGRKPVKRTQKKGKSK